MRLKKIACFFIGFMALTLVSPSCTLKLDGSSIPPEMKTIYVGYFENNALFVQNSLSQLFTEALKNRIRSQTKLSIVRTETADGAFTGYITAYTIAPVSIQASDPSKPPIANASRLSITVKVKLTYDPKVKGKGFEQDFTRTADFTGDIASQEQALIAKINKDLTEDIFNKAFADW
jgi:hypothetical protein